MGLEEVKAVWYAKGAQDFEKGHACSGACGRGVGSMASGVRLVSLKDQRVYVKVRGTAPCLVAVAGPFWRIECN